MKVCIVCYGLRGNNIRLQPWRYISEIAIGLSKRGFNVTIITDGSYEKSPITGITTKHINKLRKLPFQSNKCLISLIKSEKSDIVLWSINALDYFYLNMFKQIDIPIIGMLTGPIYNLLDIQRIGTQEILRNIKFLSIHILYASMPSFFIRDIVNSSYCKKVFVMSRRNKQIIVNNGGDIRRVIHIPVGIDESDFAVYDDYRSIIDKYDLERNQYNILYFGSPLTIRGIDSLLKAISKVKYKHSHIKLLILSRHQGNELNYEELRVENLIKKLNIEENVQIVSGFLSKDEVKKFICFSNLIALPFKIAPSDVPTSILESMALGKAVISTEVDGIPELLDDGRGFIVRPNKEEDIAKNIYFSIQNQDFIKLMGAKAAAYMQTYPKWSTVLESVISEITEIVDKPTSAEVSL